MSEPIKIEWGKTEYTGLLERWPKDEKGQPEAPVFLCAEKNLDMSDELLVNMLEAFQIPCVRVYPGDGAFGRVVLGTSGWGVNLYVPESLYEDAKELIKGVDEDEKL